MSSFIPKFEIVKALLVELTVYMYPDISNSHALVGLRSDSYKWGQIG